MKNTHINEIPYLRWLMPLIIGISIAFFSDFSAFWLPIIAFVIMGLLFFASYLWYKLLPWKHRYFMGIVQFLFLGTVGYVLALYHFELDKPQHFSKQKATYLAARLTEPPTIKPTSVKYTLKIFKSYNGSSALNCNGQAVVFTKNTPNTKALKYGDILLLKNTLLLTKPATNPGSFDYKAYLAKKNIFHSAFLDTGAFSKIGEGYKNPLYSTAYFLSGKLSAILKQYIHSNTARSILEALSIGDRSELTPEVNESFANTGTIHILSVSGMHIGLIYGSLELLLVLVLFKRQQRSLSKAAIIITVIWLYAFISGFSPPILRACIMYSFIVFGKNLSRSVNIYNLLSLSAFIQLVLEPMALFDIGFQLSYMALFGIVSLVSIMEKWLKFKNPALKIIYTGVCVALAAQIITLPLALYYFHQMPNYFLLANLSMLIIADFLVFGCIFLFLFSWLVPVAKVIAAALTWLTDALYFVLEHISHWPYALSEYFFADRVVLGILLLLVMSLVFLINFQRKVYVFSAFVAVLALFAYHAFIKINHSAQHKLIVYDYFKPSPVIGLINGSTIDFYAEKPIDSVKFSQNFKPSLAFYGLKTYNWHIIKLQDSLADYSLSINKYVLNVHKVKKHKEITIFTPNSTQIQISNKPNDAPNAYNTSVNGAYILNL